MPSVGEYADAIAKVKLELNDFLARAKGGVRAETESIDWSDLESGLGQYVNEFSSEEEYEAVYYDIRNSLRDYLKENIFDVCGMTRTGFWTNEAAKDMVCSQYMYDPESGESSLMGKENVYILTPAYQSGGAGLISCVDDYIKFVTEMSNGNRLLKPETIELMRADQLGEQAYQDFQSGKTGYTYGLGVRTDAYGRFAHKGEFGWDGAAGAYVMIDPDNHIGIFYATHVRNHGTYLYQELHQNIRDAVYRVIAAEK